MSRRVAMYVRVEVLPEYEPVMIPVYEEEMRTSSMPHIINRVIHSYQLRTVFPTSTTSSTSATSDNYVNPLDTESDRESAEYELDSFVGHGQDDTHLVASDSETETENVTVNRYVPTSPLALPPSPPPYREPEDDGDGNCVLCNSQPWDCCCMNCDKALCFTCALRVQGNNEHICAYCRMPFNKRRRVDNTIDLSD